jgi:hypothetical protein
VARESLRPVVASSENCGINCRALGTPHRDKLVSCFLISGQDPTPPFPSYGVSYIYHFIQPEVRGTVTARISVEEALNSAVR